MKVESYQEISQEIERGNFENVELDYYSCDRI